MASIVFTHGHALETVDESKLKLPPFSVSWDADEDEYYTIGIFEPTASEKVGYAHFFAFDIPGSFLSKGVIVIPWRSKLSGIRGYGSLLVLIYKQNIPMFIAYNINDLVSAGEAGPFVNYVGNPDNFPYPETTFPNIYGDGRNAIQKTIQIRSHGGIYVSHPPGSMEREIWQEKVDEKINIWRLKRGMEPTSQFPIRDRYGSYLARTLGSPGSLPGTPVQALPQAPTRLGSPEQALPQALLGLPLSPKSGTLFSPQQQSPLSPRSANLYARFTPVSQFSQL